MSGAEPRFAASGSDIRAVASKLLERSQQRASDHPNRRRVLMNGSHEAWFQSPSKPTRGRWSDAVGSWRRVGAHRHPALHSSCSMAPTNPSLTAPAGASPWISTCLRSGLKEAEQAPESRALPGSIRPEQRHRLPTPRPVPSMQGGAIRLLRFHRCDGGFWPFGHFTDLRLFRELCLDAQLLPGAVPSIPYCTPSAVRTVFRRHAMAAEIIHNA
jgi:hypothetical protein